MFNCGKMQYSGVCFCFKMLLTLHIPHLRTGWPAKGLGSCLPNPSSILGLLLLSELQIWNGMKRIIPCCFLSSQALYNSIKNEKLEWAV